LLRREFNLHKNDATTEDSLQKVGLNVKAMEMQLRQLESLCSE